MGREKSAKLDFRYYDMPQEDPIIVLNGEGWWRVYGSDAPNMHFHNAMEIGICHEGRGVMRYEDETVDYRDHMITVIPKSMPHNTVNREGEYSLWSYLFIDVHAYLMKFFKDDPEFVRKTETRIHRRHFQIAEEENPILRDAVLGIIREHKEQKAYARETINSYVLQILLMIARENRDFNKTADSSFQRRSKQISNTIFFIETNYEKPLTTADMAKAAGLSETHFRRTFLDSTGMKPSDYLNLIRIQQSCQMLLKTENSVEIIAEKCGFGTLSSFHRNFRRFTGETPLHWKTTHMGNESGTMKIRALRGWDGVNT